jgi:hypothetical protein
MKTTTIITKYSYFPTDPTHLQFNPNETILVYKRLDTGWYYGTIVQKVVLRNGNEEYIPLVNRIGWFPSNYCYPLQSLQPVQSMGGVDLDVEEPMETKEREIVYTWGGLSVHVIHTIRTILQQIKLGTTLSTGDPTINETDSKRKILVQTNAVLDAINLLISCSLHSFECSLEGSEIQVTQEESEETIAKENGGSEQFSLQKEDSEQLKKVYIQVVVSVSRFVSFVYAYWQRTHESGVGGIGNANTNQNPSAPNLTQDGNATQNDNVRKSPRMSMLAYPTTQTRPNIPNPNRHTLMAQVPPSELQQRRPSTGISPRLISINESSEIVRQSSTQSYHVAQNYHNGTNGQRSSMMPQQSPPNGHRSSMMSQQSPPNRHSMMSQMQHSQQRRPSGGIGMNQVGMGQSPPNQSSNMMPPQGFMNGQNRHSMMPQSHQASRRPSAGMGTNGISNSPPNRYSMMAQAQQQAEKRRPSTGIGINGKSGSPPRSSSIPFNGANMIPGSPVFGSGIPMHGPGPAVIRNSTGYGSSTRNRNGSDGLESVIDSLYMVMTAVRDFATICGRLGVPILQPSPQKPITTMELNSNSDDKGIKNRKNKLRWTVGYDVLLLEETIDRVDGDVQLFIDVVEEWEADRERDRVARGDFGQVPSVEQSVQAMQISKEGQKEGVDTEKQSILGERDILTLTKLVINTIGELLSLCDDITRPTKHHHTEEEIEYNVARLSLLNGITKIVQIVQQLYGYSTPSNNGGGIGGTIFRDSMSFSETSRSIYSNPDTAISFGSNRDTGLGDIIDAVQTLHKLSMEVVYQTKYVVSEQYKSLQKFLNVVDKGGNPLTGTGGSRGIGMGVGGANTFFNATSNSDGGGLVEQMKNMQIPKEREELVNDRRGSEASAASGYSHQSRQSYISRNSRMSQLSKQVRH